MIASLQLFSSTEVNPRFYRTHYLVALGLLSLAATGAGLETRAGFWWLLAGAVLLACLGSVVWSVEGNPASRIIGIATALWLIVIVEVRAGASIKELPPTFFTGVFFGELASAALLGTAVTAMLLGHSYLIAPGMSLAPLMRLLAALFWATGFRIVLAGCGLWSWTAHHSLVNWEDETVLWLPVRWGLGFGGPLVLGWMACSSAKIRSTQSATGILYVVVIFSFLGELTSQLLSANTGYML
jgi:hypothetical protein